MDVFEYLSKLANKEYIKKNYSLDNIKTALEFLNSPQKKLKNIIHITGTNGKGSVAIYTSKLINLLGYTTGLFISPHIFDVTERIQYNNLPIKKRFLKKYLLKIYESVPKEIFLKLTYFELLTCAMFLFFSEKKPDFTILEVGLGGKLDATNVIENSLISCITSISLDHTEVLGKTELEILKDKSYIIKPNSIFVCGELKEKLRKYLMKLCKEKNTQFIYCKNDIFKLNFDPHKWTTTCKYKIEGKEYTAVFPVCSLSHSYNFKLALTIIQQLYVNNLINKIDYSKIFKEVPKIIIPFRMEKFHFAKSEIIVDGGHNPKAISKFVKLINNLKLDKFLICFTMMKDKDYISSIKILSALDKKIWKFIVYGINTPRALNIDVLYKEALKNFSRKKVIKITNVRYLLKYLRNFCIEKKVFFIGSFYISKFFPKNIWKKKFTM